MVPLMPYQLRLSNALLTSMMIISVCEGLLEGPGRGKEAECCLKIVFFERHVEMHRAFDSCC